MTDHSTPTNGVVDVSIGTGSVTVRDHAEVTVAGVTAWTGSVAFSLCKLPLTPTTSNCATGGVCDPVRRSGEWQRQQRQPERQFAGHDT